MARPKASGSRRRRPSRVRITAAGVAAAAAVAGVVIAAWPKESPDSVELAVECEPVHVAPGQTVDLTYRVTRHGKPLSLGFGATLIDGSGRETYDPAHDKTFLVRDGSDSYPRAFVVPEGTAAGRYRLLVQVWRGKIGGRVHDTAAAATCPAIEVASP